MKYLFTIFLTFLFFSLAVSKNKIEGVLYDAQTKAPLAFANIVVSGKTEGTVSNSEGRFVLSVLNLSEQDTVLFSYVGYETTSHLIADLGEESDIYLKSSTVNLSEVTILSRSLSVKEILEKVIENYSVNHPMPNQKMKLFARNFINTPYSEKNKLFLKKSDFEGIDNKMVDGIMNRMPRQFINYNDALVEMYSFENQHKLKPIKGISLEEGSQKDLLKDIKNELSFLADDFKKTMSDENTYYKFKTGIIGLKMDFEDDKDDDWDVDESEKDELHYTVPVNAVKGEILGLINEFSTLDGTNLEFIINEFSTLDGNNLEFISKPGKYNYTLNGFDVFNNEFAYKISFRPKSGGVFEGTIYISTQSYAILQMEYAFAKGKSKENIQLLGLGHAINMIKGRVIYEKYEGAYYMKYINAEEIESGSFERKFSIMKKQKRFLIDKELNEMKFDAEFFFDVHSQWELLVMKRETLNKSDFEKIQQEKVMKFKKEYSNSLDIWNNSTIITPTAELKNYTRQNKE